MASVFIIECSVCHIHYCICTVCRRKKGKGSSSHPDSAALVSRPRNLFHLYTGFIHCALHSSEGLRRYPYRRRPVALRREPHAMGGAVCASVHHGDLSAFLFM